MFGVLRDKFKEVISKISSSAGEEEKEVRKVSLAEKAKAFVTGYVVLDEKKLDEVLQDFELSLLEGDVALDVVDKIIQSLREKLYSARIKRDLLQQEIRKALRETLLEIVKEPDVSFEELVRSKKPFVILFVGVNGTGKTTTIAKVAKYLKDLGLEVVLAASDTFRAGAIEQLQEHADRLGVRLIKHEKGSDPAAVAYDAIEHAKAKGKDVVLIDTAGRMETNVNLMDEMKKIARVAKPDLILFVGDALTGNAALEQAERFSQAVNIDGIILTKADADAKGGSALSISYATGKPIFFLGTGQEYTDLKPFRAEEFVDELLG